MSDLTIADISEFQTMDWSVFHEPAVIVRAHNSTRADNKWYDNALHASQQCRWWAAYQYLTKTADPATAAQAFLATLGSYRPNATIVDIEEGDGDQQARQHAWLDVMANDPACDWTYSGDYYARTHNIVPLDWVAAYQLREPTVAHTLWQFTDKQTFDGIAAPCDASVFHGTIDDLINLTGGNMPITDADAEKIASAVWSTKISAFDGQQYPAYGVITFVSQDAHAGAAQSGALVQTLTIDKLVAGLAAALPGLTPDQIKAAVKAAIREGTA